MSDQHSRKVTGAYGNSLVRTPNLDRLAAEGTRFSGVCCAAPVCVPSRMSFMTGRIPSRNRVWNNHGVLSSGIPTWSHALGAAGYETALIGRMHFLGPDQRHGFMHRPIAEGSARHPGAAEQGGPRYTRLPGATAGQQRHSFEYAGRGHSFYQYYDTDVTKTACHFLEERTGQEKPFAAVVGFLLPHCPFIGPKEAFDYYYDRIETTVELGSEPKCIEALREWRNLHPEATEHQLRVARAAYYAMIECMDRNVGRIVDTLERTEQAENTLVIYCSDHGEMLGEHGLWSKKCFYEDAVGVPLIARLPGLTQPGTDVTDPCSLVDLAPTFYELANAPATDVDGESLVPVFEGHENRERTIVSEVADVNFGTFQWVGKMVRQGPWKLWQHITAEGDEWEPVLFNLNEDPDEKNNLAAEPAHNSRRKSMMGHLERDWEPMGISREVRGQLQDMQVLKAWARKVEPEHPDTYVWPGPETEEDLELL